MVDRLIGIDDVCQLIGMKRSVTYHMTKKGELPQPVDVQHRRMLWSYNEIQQWIADKLANRQGQ